MKSMGGLSLSMKMRMGSQSTDKKLGNSDSEYLPKVDQQIRTSKNRILNMADNSIKCTNKAAKLSGSLGYIAGTTGTSADRTQTIRPSICCVRCSLHASICMDCCDLQAQNAITFYRRTLGKGASDILSRAIMEAGLGNMSKHIIFTLWKNGCHSRIRRRQRESIELGRQYDVKMMKRPLAAWKKYTQDEILRKKKKAMIDLEYDCKQLEKKMEQIVHTNERTESEMDRLREQMIRSVAVNDGYIETIRGLRSQLAEEKSRVLALSLMCEHVRTLSTAMSSYAQEEYGSNSRALIEFGCRDLSYHDGSLYSSASREVIQKFAKLRSERTMGAVAKTRFLFKSETDAANKMLIQWLNHVSRECVNSLPHPLLDAAGGESTIDFSLPAHEQVYEAAELRSGKALSRVVTFLIHSISPFERVTAGDQSEALTNSEGDKESKNDLLGSCSSPSRTIDAQFEKKKGEICFTMDHISALKDAENDPKVLLELTVKYASDFLHLPLYNFQDILDGLKKETFIFLGNLYLSNSPITIEKYGQSSKCSSLENGGVKTTQEKLRLKVEQGSRWLLEIEKAIKEYDMSSKMIAPAVNYSLAVELDPTTGLKSEQTNYYKLQKTIDDVFNSNGFVSIDHSVKALKANITEIMQMKKTVSVAQKRKHEEIRTANEIRVFVSRNILQNLTTPLGMVKEET